MSREVRKVPKDWKHPTIDGKYVPLFNVSFNEDYKKWKEEKEQWEKGFCYSYSKDKFVPKDLFHKDIKFEDWHYEPDPKNYMPFFLEEEKTHYMMYETTSEGTPISPAFETPEELAYWLASTGASAFADLTATYDEWLNMIKGPGYSVTALYDSKEKKLRSGVSDC